MSRRALRRWCIALAVFFAAYFALRTSRAAMTALWYGAVLPAEQWLGRLCGRLTLSVGEVLILTAVFCAILWLANVPRRIIAARGCRWGMALRLTLTALCAVLAALALGLSTLEGLFPISLLVPLPGVKLGLANIVTVFALYQLGAGAALAILLTRCLLGGLFAGNLSAMLFSVLGGLTAMLVMIFLRRLPKLSVYGVSIGGAAAHNIGQMAAAVITLGSTMVLGYLPFLLAVSLFTGALTGFITALLLRATRHIRFH